MDKDGSFNLTFNDKGRQYSYNGVRTTKDGNYVLIFDPAREVFVLHRLDSLFHMNVTKTPGNTDVERLQKQFPQLEVEQPASSKPADDKGDIQENSKDSSKEAGTTKRPAVRAKANSALRKNTTSKQAHQQKKAPPKKAAAGAHVATSGPSGSSTSTTNSTSSGRKNTSSSSTAKSDAQPTPQPPSSNNKKRNKTPDPEDEDDDDDGGLILEFPGGHQPRPAPKYVPPTAFNRRFSDFVNAADEDANDEDTEQGGASFQGGDAEAGDNDDDDELDISVLNNYKPAPAPPAQLQTMSLAFEGGDAATPQADAPQDDGGFDDADIEAELEAEFEAEFSKDDGHDSESDVSEED